jgi:hypothetical protein
MPAFFRQQARNSCVLLVVCLPGIAWIQRHISYTMHTNYPSHLANIKALWRHANSFYAQGCFIYYGEMTVGHDIYSKVTHPLNAY